LLLIILTSCVKRSFHSGFDSDRSDTVVSVELFQDSFYSAAREALDRFSEEDLESFFDRESMSALRSDSKDDFWTSLQMNVPLSWGLERSAVSPVHLTRAGPSGIPRGGIVVFGGNVFPEGYFRSRASFLPLKSLMTEAPWFEWNDKSKSYTPKKSGAPEQILKTMFEFRGQHSTLTLYRGTSIADELAPTLDRDPYRSGTSEYQQVMHFSSPSVNTALVWARPAVWSSEIPRKELLDAVRMSEPVVYVGFEYGYPEIAFLNSSKVSVPIFRRENRAKILCVNEEKLAAQTNDNKLFQSLKKCDDRWAETFTSGFPEPIVLNKTATVRVQTLLKSVAIPDSELEEGYLVCRLNSGVKIQYVDAFPAERDQVWIHANKLEAEWGCPRGFATTRFYVDKSHVLLEPTLYQD
jgi:hypothetical protein